MTEMYDFLLRLIFTPLFSVYTQIRCLTSKDGKTEGLFREWAVATEERMQRNPALKGVGVLERWEV